MGTLRILLAISVLLTHCYGFVFVGGQNAVRMFYMVSGFLISHVLLASKSYSTVSAFYINRYLRLYPVYCYVAALSLVYLVVAYLAGINDVITDVFLQAPLSAKLLIVLTNAGLFFQDWLMLVGIDGSSLVFAGSNANGAVVLWQAMLVPQAWTLGFELVFYLMAPLVLPRKPLLFALLGFSLLVRIFVDQSGLGLQAPFAYQFFPAELWLFLAGALAQQYLLPAYKKLIAKNHIDVVAKAATVFLIVLVVGYWLIPLQESLKQIALFAFFLLLLPFPFMFQAGNKWDKKIGDLSYPLYICHGLVIKVATFWLATLNALEPSILASVVLVASLMFAMTLEARVGKPMELLRKRFRTRSES